MRYFPTRSRTPSPFIAVRLYAGPSLDELPPAGAAKGKGSFVEVFHSQVETAAHPVERAGQRRDLVGACIFELGARRLAHAIGFRYFCHLVYRRNDVAIEQNIEQNEQHEKYSGRNGHEEHEVAPYPLIRGAHGNR